MSYIDSSNLAHFKTKQDEANDKKFANKTDIKTKTSELENDKEFQTAEEVRQAIAGEIPSIPIYKGATSSDAGVTGTVPAAESGVTDALLCSDGTWMKPMTTDEIDALFK